MLTVIIRLLNQFQLMNSEADSAIRGHIPEERGFINNVNAEIVAVLRNMNAETEANLNQMAAEIESEFTVLNGNPISLRDEIDARASQLRDETLDGVNQVASV